MLLRVHFVKHVQALLKYHNESFKVNDQFIRHVNVIWSSAQQYWLLVLCGTLGTFKNSRSRLFRNLIHNSLFFIPFNHKDGLLGTVTRLAFFIVLMTNYYDDCNNCYIFYLSEEMYFHLFIYLHIYLLTDLVINPIYKGIRRWC